MSVATCAAAGPNAGAAAPAPARAERPESADPSPPSSPSSTPLSAGPPSDAPRARPITPAGAGAVFYASSGASSTASSTASSAGARGAARPDDRLRAAIVEEARRLARKGGLTVPEGDPRLDLAMTDLARSLRGDDLPALDVVDFLLAHYGMIEPSPHLLMERASGGGDQKVREQTAGQLVEMLASAPMARVGVGVHRAGDQIYVVVALQEKNLELLQPIPRRLAVGAAAVIAGQLARSFRDPHLVVTEPGGAVRELATPARGASFRAELRCDAGVGRYQVEVTGVNDRGIAVLANFPLYCGMAPPGVAPRGTGEPPNALSPPAAEARLLALVNQDRRAAGVPPVAIDETLAGVARAHSRDMAEHELVAHVSPRTGTALDRAHRAGLSPAIIFENVGRAYSADEAEVGFMASPGHRSNILDRRATRIGIGVVPGRPVTGTTPLFVTQLLM
jgi:hypothetical protein